MTFQFNFPQTENANFTVSPNTLENARLALRHADFEILEIWHEDEIHVYEVWQHTCSGVQIRLDVGQETAAKDEPLEATRQDVVNELVDLWIELRAIRRHFTEAPDYYDEYSSIVRPKTPLQRFWEKVSEFELERAADPEVWSFIFNTGVDETVCAYNELSAQDRLAITH